ncbi:hypothetical protein B1748_27760 [Paenibacillus sp. MY03]|uniref:LacI family DNA-binding transcriptional regulator n=1 Tax=Paenibacillus sp. MY03 TaxID=302980 RepID=UPI000B3D4FB8|nr:LacI family DNA-binding transcriptional regulator [Paenibacillus sp. MY03]OUS70787.1 hypothetical protein B1748_27760 [Paenibacillus sp. MY03]
MVTLKDVALKAGVSEATASLAMNNKKTVNADTKKKVLDTARQMGYIPNSLARGLARSKTNTIGLVVTDVQNPYFGSIVNYIDQYLRKFHYNLILSVSNDDIEAENQIIENFIRQRVDGVIVIPAPVMRGDFSVFAHLESNQIPYVFSTTYYEGMTCDSVMTDLSEGSFLLAEYLIGLGHRRIMFLASANQNVLLSKLRIEGCKRAYSEAGMDLNDLHIVECSRNDFNSGYKAVLDYFNGTDRPDAVMAINDIMALGAMKAIKELGMRIPQDISVAGYDDLIFSSISDVSLTTVRQIVPEICMESVQILLDRIEGKTAPPRITMIQPELIIRRSTSVRAHQ